MDKLVDITIKWLSKPLAIPIVLQIIILFGMLKIGDLSKSVPLSWQKEYEKIPILSIATTLALSCLLWALSYFSLYLKYRNKLKPKCGILWDKDKEAYCPACKTLLSGYTERPPEYYIFWCHSCKARIYLMHLGSPISLTEAKKLL